MKTKQNIVLQRVFGAGLLAALNASASTDYSPAIWRPACSSEQYTSGNGHRFLVVHDMEGYYAYNVTSGLVTCGGSSVSVHYAINGKKDASSDMAAGEVTQMVRESHYAWHARCWNTYSAGCEHEGFASNPAWFTEELYQASASLYRHMADAYGIAKDRNHIVGHNADSSSAWVNWADTGLGIDPTCNTHSDPGPYWDWSYFMDLINPPTAAVSGTPLRFKMDVNGDGKTDVVLLYKNGSSTTARVCLSTGSAFGSAVDKDMAIGYGTLNVDRQWIPMDVNGDGKTDLVLIWKNSGAASAKTYLSTGTSFGSGSDSTVAGTFGTVNVNRFWTKGDVNGDGKEDIILIWNSDGQAVARTCLSTGSGFGITADSVVAGTFGTLNVDRQWIPMEVNGDGKKDLVLIWNNAGVAKARVCLTSGTTFSIGADSTVAGDFGTLGGDRLWLNGDVNGDGKEDLIMIWNKDGEGTARMCHSTGSSFTLDADSVLCGTFGTLGVDRQYIPMDINGDGKTDVALIWNNAGVAKARSCISSGTSFGNTPDSIVAGSFGTLGGDRLWLKGDVSGDGKEDLIMIWDNGGSGYARTCLTTGSTFGITSDTSVCGTFGTFGVDRWWLPPGM